jgi:hypothetical protein
VRLREILGRDLAGQTRAERSSIRERLRPGHNVHAVGFGTIEQQGGHHPEASSEDDPATGFHAVDDTRILNVVGRFEQEMALPVRNPGAYRKGCGAICEALSVRKISERVGELWMSAPAACALALLRSAACCNADSAVRRTASTSDTIGNRSEVAIRLKAPATFLPCFVYRPLVFFALGRNVNLGFTPCQSR